MEKEKSSRATVGTCWASTGDQRRRSSVRTPSRGLKDVCSAVTDGLGWSPRAGRRGAAGRKRRGSGFHCDRGEGAGPVERRLGLGLVGGEGGEFVHGGPDKRRGVAVVGEGRQRCCYRGRLMVGQSRRQYCIGVCWRLAGQQLACCLRSTEQGGRQDYRQRAVCRGWRSR